MTEMAPPTPWRVHCSLFVAVRNERKSSWGSDDDDVCEKCGGSNVPRFEILSLTSGILPIVIAGATRVELPMPRICQKAWHKQILVVTRVIQPG